MGVADTPTFLALDHVHFLSEVDLVLAEAALLMPPPCTAPCSGVQGLKLVGGRELSLQFHSQLALKESAQ